ncbi:hypothetical protein C7B76_08375 [filamentous cyanobacterium CCP2]|nr:hypothetical protein C7B76_08375 [filamentous cyanobacterium CCP2]
MYRRSANGQIRPKISTMPRQQSEAAAFLDIYKLVIEKKRLQQELQGMEQRRQQIVDRLAVLETQVSTLEKAAHQLREDEPQRSSGERKPKGRSKEAELPAETLETLFLEY